MSPTPAFFILTRPTVKETKDAQLIYGSRASGKRQNLNPHLGPLACLPSP